MDYRAYLFGTAEPVEMISILEIGGSNGFLGGPIADSLHHRKAAFVTYRDLTLGTGIGRWLSRGYDFQRLRWDARQMPYPFGDAEYDEMHCHNANVGLEDEKISQFGDEVVRLVQPRGRFYLTTQHGTLFGNSSVKALGCQMEQLITHLERNGFSVEEFASGNGALSSNIDVSACMKRPTSQLGDVWMFTNFAQYTNVLLIARKRE